MIRKALVKRGDQIVEVMVDDNTFKKGGSYGGLDRWFAEEWVDIKTGKPCGRQEGENRKGYPACRPSKRVSSETPKTASELSSSEKAKFKRAKQSSSRIPYQHKRRQEGGESNDKQMVDGIADILSQVEDMNNRKQIAKNMLADFRNEDVSFNYQDFLDNSGLPELKSGGNKPTNPALWSRAKALARSKFDVYPCVTMDSQALTKDGWKYYNELKIGDEILAHNIESNINEWTPIISLQKFEDAPIIRLYKKQTNFDIKCTPNHKWVLDEENSKYPENLVEAKDITKRMKIRTSAVLGQDNEPLNIFNFFKKDSWVKNILKMAISQVQSFFASGIVYDGNDKGLSKDGKKQTYGFSQKDIDHGLAMEIAATLLGYRVCSSIKNNNKTMRNWTFIRRTFESTQNLYKEDAGKADVWCPTTKFNTWVMKQNGYVTITGNSAYANGWAAKWYKGKGGGWRKAQEGGQEDFYTPDTGIEQFAPDQSWYESNSNASAPGNIVSWPSYPKGTGIPMSELPPKAMPQRIPSSQGSIYLGTGRYAGRPSNPMLSLDNNYSRYQEDMPEYRRSFDLFNRIGQGFNNMGEAIGNGFDNLSDFFQRMKKNRKRARRERRGRRGNGLLNCKPGTKCAKFQEGGEESDQMEEILDQIEDALEQGVKSEEILLQLTEMGIDEEQAQMLIEEAIQDLQEDAQEEEGNGEEENNGEEKEMEDDEMYASGGSYRVYKTSERKGKTHKVVGPGGVTKYFGDPKLGERSKSKYGKKGFYARHKKNLAKNPFFRAYARATWAEGGEPSFMQTPEFKTNSFVDLIKSEAENNAYKNIMNQAQEMFMQMGGAQDYGYVGNPYADMYQQNLDDLQAKGNVENAFFNGLNQIGLAAEKGIKTAANIIAPGSGAIVSMAMDAQRPKSLTDPTSKGISGDGIASMLKGVISDPEALTGFLARYGGSLPRFQGDIFGSEFDGSPTQIEGSFLDPNAPVAGGALPDLSWWDSSQNNPVIPKELDKSSSPYPSGNQTIPLPSPSKPKTQMPGGGIDWLSIGKDIVTAMAYRGKAKKTKAKMADMNAGDNVFAAAETLNRGDFERNTGMLKPDQYIMGTTQGIPALARYGGNLKRAKHGGVQKDGVYMSYPTATPESVVYGEQPKKPSNTLQPIKRELANLEAEDGETAITPAGVDGVPKFWKIGGERHSNGGTPLNLPDGSFIFSDTKSMKLGGDILEELGIKGKKKRTPAEISKILGKGYEKFVMIIQDPNSDKIERRTAELMIENQIKKLGMLALAQESKKGFPEGIPMIAVPYMESVGIAPEQILPQPQMGMEEMGMPQQMPMEMPMARYGLQKYQTAGQSDDNFFNSEYYRQRMFGASPTIKAPEKSVWEQYPDAWNIFQAANQSTDIDMIGKAQVYLNKIDVPFSIGFPGTDQDIIENAANTLRDRALMLERDYKKAKKEYEHNQNVNTLSTLKQQIIEIKKNTPKTPENIDKLNELDLAIKDLSVFTPNNIVSKIDKYSYLGKKITPKPVINKPTQQKNNIAVQDTVPVVAPSTPAPAPTQSKPKSVEKKSETKKNNKVTFGAGDLNGIQIIQ